MANACPDHEIEAIDAATIAGKNREEMRALVSDHERQRGGYDGIGFVLTEHDPYCFIDLDDTSKAANAAELFDRQDRIYISRSVR